MTDIVSVVKDEIRALERELQGDPRFQKLTRLREVLALYEGPVGAAQPTSTIPPAEPVISPSRGVGKIKRKSDPSRMKVLEHAANVIRGRDYPTKTADIYELLGEIGGLIRGSDPKSNLSAMLWNSPHFRSHGRAGWTLSEFKFSRSGEEDTARETDDEAEAPMS